MVKTALLFVTLLIPTISFAGIHDSCHTDDKDSRAFAVGYVGAILDIKRDVVAHGRQTYTMPALNYSEAFDAVCAEIDKHPELWSKPSRDAVTFAVDALWKRKEK
jgi:hypothetical protein